VSFPAGEVNGRLAVTGGSPGQGCLPVARRWRPRTPALTGGTGVWVPGRPASRAGGPRCGENTASTVRLVGGGRDYRSAEPGRSAPGRSRAISSGLSQPPTTRPLTRRALLIAGSVRLRSAGAVVAMCALHQRVHERDTSFRSWSLWPLAMRSKDPSGISRLVPNVGVSARRQSRW
jgi:hypothetical protein